MGWFERLRETHRRLRAECAFDGFRVPLNPTFGLKMRRACTRRGQSALERAVADASLASFPIHNVKQRRLLRSRGALLRPGCPSCSRPSPIEGRAERRQAHLFCCRAGEARPIRTRRGAARPMTRDARLSALHRGDFRPGAALPSPALPPDPCSELLAARSSCLAGGVPDLPSPRLRAAAAGRHSPLRLQDRL